jgi:CHAT domain-containing protein/tetratricopeptide (TPR) repeat protein
VRAGGITWSGAHTPLSAMRSRDRHHRPGRPFGLFWLLPLLVVWVWTVPAAWAIAPDDLSSGLARCDSLADSGRAVESEKAARALLRDLTSPSPGQQVDSLQIAEVFDRIVRSLLGQGRAGTPECRDLAQRLFRIFEARLGPDDLNLARGAFYLSQNFEAIHDLGPARAFAERALAIREAGLPADDPLLARALVQLANVRARQADYDGVAELYQRALDIQEKAGTPLLHELAGTLLNFAILRKLTGDYDGARRTYERALEIQRRVLGPEHPNVARTLHNLGNLLVYTGDYDAAMEDYRAALAIRERALGPEAREVAQTLAGMAVLDHERGDLVEARAKVERALAIFEKQPQLDAPLVGETLVTLASILLQTGDASRAEPVIQRGLTLYENSLGPDHPRVAEALGVLARLRRSQEDLNAAKQFYQRALSIRERALGPESADVASNLLALADLLVEAGDADTARALLTRALGIREKVSGLDHPETGLVLLALGKLEWSGGSLAQAGADLERGLEIVRKALGREHPSYAQGLLTLAHVRSEEGDAAGALDLALQAEALGRNYLRLTTRGLSEDAALRNVAAQEAGLDLALSIAADEPGDSSDARRVWNELVQSRALVLDEMALRRAVLSERNDDATRDLRRRLAEDRRELAWLAVSGWQGKTSEALRARLEAVRAREDETERLLAERSRACLGERELTRVDLSTVISSLPPRSALVAYVRYHRFARASTGPKASSSSNRPSIDAGVLSYAALVRPPGGPDVMIALGTADEIDLLIGGWRDELGYGCRVPGRSPAAAEAACRVAGEPVRERIWDPIEPYLAGADRVFLVPDASLSLVNFAGLPSEDGRYLLEDAPLLHVLTAERDLVQEPTMAVQGEGLLAFGAPDFNAVSTAPLVRSATGTVASGPGASPETEPASAPFRGARVECDEFQHVVFAPLPQSAREVKEIAGLWNEAAKAGRAESSPSDSALSRAQGGREDPGRTTVLTGAAANEAALKAEAHGYRDLHLATHGFFLGEECRTSSGSARGVGAIRPSSPEVTRDIGVNPLLLSGLALAGANRRNSPHPGAEDGILTAEEIAALDLSGTRWAVLSACESGLGKSTSGQGVLGLRRAFRIAGAASVIMSLWPVEDEAARRWMTELYRAHLLENQGTAESVRSASLQALQKRRKAGLSTHPYYWAGFIACGDWR